MSHIWVYTLDGSQQCGWTEAAQLIETRAALAKIIDETNIIAEYEGQVPLFIPTACGYPTGGAHIFHLTDEGAHILFKGVVGPSGFCVWVWEPPAEARTMAEGFALPWPFPWSHGDRVLTSSDPFASYAANFISSVTQVGAQPTTLAEVIGRQCRYYEQGELLTLDYLPLRVNVEHDNHRVLRIWFG